MADNINDRLALLEIALSEISEGNYTEEIKEELKTWKEYADNFINIIPSRDVSFRTKSRLDKILDRLELTDQDRRDLEKYINFGGGETLQYIKESLEIFLKYKDKILNIIQDAPEEFDTLIEIFDYIEEHIEDAPFEKSEAENSAVLKGGNNQVISEGGVALGKNNLVGLKGFYYKHIRFVSNTLANIYLNKTQVIPTITTGEEIKDTIIIPANYLTKGDVISIVNDNKYNDVAVINNMSEGMIQIKWLSEAPFESIKKETNLSPEDYSIYCLDKPTQGISDLGKYSFANGTDNKAINTYTEVSGKGNIAKGKFGKVWGKDNIGGYNTTTFGTGNINLADNSIVSGINNINEGNNSVIHGNKNKNYGKRAFVVGNENITHNENEAAFGKYNNSESDTQFSIGIGTSDTDRKNAVEVTQDGRMFVKGVGGYNGTSLEAKDLATVLKENGQGGSSNEYVITQFSYSNVIQKLNDGEYLEYSDDEDLLNALQNNKTIFIKDTNVGGKILCDYTIGYGEHSTYYHIKCGLIKFTVESYNDSITICDFALIESSGGGNVIIADFTTIDIENAYADGNTFETTTNFSAAFNNENPANIIILNNKDEYVGYSKVLNVDGYYGGAQNINLYFIYNNYYYRVSVNPDMWHITTIKRAPMPAFE